MKPKADSDGLFSLMYDTAESSSEMFSIPTLLPTVLFLCGCESKKIYCLIINTNINCKTNSQCKNFLFKEGDKNMRSISWYALNLMLSFKTTSCPIISKISTKFSLMLIKAAEIFRFM